MKWGLPHIPIPVEDQDLPKEDKLDDLYATVQELEIKVRDLQEMLRTHCDILERLEKAVFSK